MSLDKWTKQQKWICYSLPNCDSLPLGTKVEVVSPFPDRYSSRNIRVKILEFPTLKELKRDNVTVSLRAKSGRKVGEEVSISPTELSAPITKSPNQEALQLFQAKGIGKDNIDILPLLTLKDNKVYFNDYLRLYLNIQERTRVAFYIDPNPGRDIMYLSILPNIAGHTLGHKMTSAFHIDDYALFQVLYQKYTLLPAMAQDPKLVNKTDYPNFNNVLVDVYNPVVDSKFPSQKFYSLHFCYYSTKSGLKANAKAKDSILKLIRERFKSETKAKAPSTYYGDSDDDYYSMNRRLI